MKIAKQAIVIGAGIGGLSAAQALANSFEVVTIIERDKLPNNVTPRAGIPQGRHPHALLPGGLAALNDLFENFTVKLRDAGAKEVDWGHHIWEYPGLPALPQRNFGVPLLMCTRPLIENSIRNQIGKTNHILILDERRVTELVPASDGNSVIAVHCVQRNGSMERHDADLIVDATGRGELTLHALRATGRAAPAESRIEVDYYLSSIAVEMPKATFGYAPIRTIPRAPDRSLVGYLLRTL